MSRKSRTEPIDSFSFQLGMINCFVEMVACGVKRLAISPPLTPEEYSRIEPASERILREFGVSSYLEKSLLTTDLQSADFTSGKWSVLYYRDRNVLDAYDSLKSRKARLESEGKFDDQARKKLSRDFMRLLSYPDDVIDAKLSLSKPKDPFVFTESEDEH